MYITYFCFCRNLWFYFKKLLRIKKINYVKIPKWCIYTT